MPKKRSGRKNRTVKNKLWIYTEGTRTEQIYIKGYINDRYSSNKRIENVFVEDVKQNTADSLIKRIKADQKTEDHNPGDTYWVAYDRESTKKYSSAMHQQALISAKDSGINVALSNVCVEQFLLWHFSASQGAYTSCDDLLKRSNLKDRMKTIGIANYQKADPLLYEKLKHLVETAINNSKRANKAIINSSEKGYQTPVHELNPFTEFYLILEAIDKFVKES